MRGFNQDVTKRSNFENTLNDRDFSKDFTTIETADFNVS